MGWCQGTGPAMLLVHGVGMRAEFWNNIEDELAQMFSLTVVDMPGHGQNPAFDEADPTLSRYSDVLAELISAKQQPVIVVGHSMGALITLDLAVRYPDQVAGIAVLNGVYRRSSNAQQAINARVAELASLQPTDPTATLERWFGAEPKGVDALSAQACRQWLSTVNPQGYRDAYRAFANTDAPTDEELQQIKCRALFMTGSLEPNSTPAMSKSMSQLLPDATCVVVEGARHMMTMTHGSDVVTALTHRFTTTNSVTQ